MTSKTFSLTLLTILSLVMVLGFASAVSLNEITVSTIPSSVSQEAGTFDITFDLTNTGVEGNLNFSDTTITSGASITFDNTYILEDTTETVTATVTFPSSMTGTISGTIDVLGESASTHRQLPFSVSIVAPERPEDISECILTGDTGNLKIEIDDINNIAGYGDDDEWLPLDEIEVDIKVDNKGDEKIRNIEIKWGLYDVTNDKFIIDEKESDFNLKDGDDKVVTVNFRLDDPGDYEDGNDFVLYAWAVGEDGEFDGQDTCVSDSASIDVIIESDFVVTDNVEYLDTASCGDSMPISAEVWNIGDSDQDAVSVVIYNKEIGFSQKVDIGDIRAFDSEPLDVVLELPNDMDEKLYQFKVEVRDEDGDVYVNDFDDDDSVYTMPLTIEGCTVAQTATVSANLESGGKAGEQMIIRTTVTNTADESKAYTVNAAGYTGWADSANVDQTTFLLPAGSSKDVMITFDVNKDAEGTKFFDLEVLSDNELVLKQPVSVQIEKSGFAADTYVWVLGILIVVLIVAILIVAVRLARR